MTMLSKISKTKKRLFDPHWETKIIFLGFLNLLIYVALVQRYFVPSSDFGGIRISIPTMQVGNMPPPPKEQSLHKNTVTLFMTPEYFLFGSLEALTKNAKKFGGKQHIPHADGSPQVNKLIEALQKSYPSPLGVAILVPSPSVPNPIIMQTIYHLRKSKTIKDVILGHGYITYAG